MPQKYYNTTETAKLLGKSVDDVKGMLERRELHGYRDGADWKFKAEDIDRLAAVSAPATLVEEEGGDVLLSEVALGQSDPGMSGTVIGMSGAGPIVTDSDIRLAESNIQLNEAAKTPIPIRKPGDSKSKFEELDLTLEEDLTLEDSTAAIAAKPSAVTGSSTVDLDGGSKEADDDLVLGGSGSLGSDVTIGGDSGISLIDPSDSGLSLETPINLGGVSDIPLDLGGSGLAVSGASSVVKSEDDFLLTPLDEAGSGISGISESDSQVTVAEPEASDVGAGSGVSMAAMLDEDLSAQPLDIGMGSPLSVAPVLGGVAAVGMSSEGAALVQPTAVAMESSYTGLQIAGLSACAAILMLCGMMMYDLLRNMWSWNGTFSVNSGLMDTILHWFGI
jgi:excisionase family DNA binding protein